MRLPRHIALTASWAVVLLIQAEPAIGAGWTKCRGPEFSLGSDFSRIIYSGNVPYTYRLCFKPTDSKLIITVDRVSQETQLSSHEAFCLDVNGQSIKVEASGFLHGAYCRVSSTDWDLPTEVKRPASISQRLFRPTAREPKSTRCFEFSGRTYCE